MILKDTITDLLIQMDVFMNKKGRDIDVRNKIIADINEITGEDTLVKIYINEVDNFNIPDVVVLPLYHLGFGKFLLDDMDTNTCPFPYMIELHERCFQNYTAEEVTALILHDILHNIESSVLKDRFMKAYNTTISKYPMEKVIDAYERFSSSDTCYLAVLDICLRPFRVPVASGYTYCGCDDVLNNLKLGDAYDSYLEKYYNTSKHWKPMLDLKQEKDPNLQMEQDIKMDQTTMDTIFMACMDHDIVHYYEMVKNGVPLMILSDVMTHPTVDGGLGFKYRKHPFHCRKMRPNSPCYDQADELASVNEVAAEYLTESYINPKTEIELRFQVDKIIADIRYAESETEREAILIKIKNLALKLTKTKMKYEAVYKKEPSNPEVKQKIEYVQNFLDELEMLRKHTLEMEIKKKRYGLFINYPANYEEDPKYRDLAIY